MVDLAGSERQSKTQATGDRLKVIKYLEKLGRKQNQSFTIRTW